MFLNVATTFTLIATCLGQEPLYDDIASDEAISTQSFNRDDIPISYKSAVHHSMRKPKDDDILRPKKNGNQEYLAIQYAPLYNIDEDSGNSTRFTKVVLDPKAGKENKKNHNLEPRRQPSRPSGPPSLSFYVPGHNIKIVKSPKRNPGHNTVYRNPETLTDAQEKTNHLRGYQKFGTGDVVPKFSRSSQNLKHEPKGWMIKQNIRPNTYMFYKGEIDQTSPNNLHPLPTHHTHRMQINVGHMNGRAQLIARELVIGDI